MTRGTALRIRAPCVNNAKVVLTGEGSDEFFWGYQIYQETKVRSPASEVAGQLGFTAEQVERVYRDIDQKRRMTAYLPTRPQMAGAGGRIEPYVIE